MIEKMINLACTDVLDTVKTVRYDVPTRIVFYNILKTQSTALLQDIIQHCEHYKMSWRCAATGVTSEIYASLKKNDFLQEVERIAALPTSEGVNTIRLYLEQPMNYTDYVVQQAKYVEGIDAIGEPLTIEALNAFDDMRSKDGATTKATIEKVNILARLGDVFWAKFAPLTHYKVAGARRRLASALNPEMQ